MKHVNCLRKITATIVILALFTPLFSFAVSGDTTINLEVVSVAPPVSPAVATNAASSITSDSALLSGNIISIGGATVTSRGFQYGLSETPTWSVSESGSYGPGSYSLIAIGLNSNTTYYFRAFATNSAGTGYGNWISFTTVSFPSALPGQPVLDVIPPIIYNLILSKINLNSVAIEWKTDEPALCQLFWGKTQEYEKEAISEIGFHLKHSTELTNLSSETNYHFKVKCRDPRGNESETPDQKFNTLAPPDITPPANVSKFEAIPGDRQIELQWKNPADPDFKAVRIVRNEMFYPKDLWEGKLVYDGRETSFVDRDLINGIRYYYTAFSYDFAGNFSSGAIVSAVPRLEPPPAIEEIFTEKECLEAGYYWYDNACHLEPKLVPAPPEVEKLTLENFNFIQKERKITIIDGKIEIKEKEPLTIVIDYDKVPEVLKTIMVTLEKDKRNFSFLLRINKEKTAYLATLMPPEEPGIYNIILTVLDYKNQTLKRIPGQLIVKETEVRPLPIPWYKNWQNWILILILLIILAAVIYLYKKLKIKYQRQKTKT